jgi:electron transfer flavoprotein alpha/beta subunit
MNVLVCCKIVPDLDRLSESDWVVQDHGQIDTGFVRTMVNPYDESALELTLRLAGAAPARLTALTIGGRQADPFLKTLHALGFDPTVRIETPGDWRFCADGIAALIAECMAAGHPQDLVVMGRQSADGDNGKTPLLLAEALGWPCVTGVLGFEAAGEGRLRVTSRVDAGLLVQVARLPLVLAVGNAAGTALRVPTLKQRMQTSRMRTEVREAPGPAAQAAIGAARRDCVLEGLSPIRRRRAGRIVAGPDARAMARNLYHECLKQRLESL